MGELLRLGSLTNSHVVTQQATHFWDLTDESASIRCCRISPNRLGSLATDKAGAAALLLGASLCCAGRILPGAVGFARWSHHRVDKYLLLRPYDEVTVIIVTIHYNDISL